MPASCLRRKSHTVTLQTHAEQESKCYNSSPGKPWRVWPWAGFFSNSQSNVFPTYRILYFNHFAYLQLSIFLLHICICIVFLLRKFILNRREKRCQDPQEESEGCELRLNSSKRQQHRQIKHALRRILRSCLMLWIFSFLSQFTVYCYKHYCSAWKILKSAILVGTEEGIEDLNTKTAEM